MASYSPLHPLILVVLLFECWVVATATSFDFYYFVQLVLSDMVEKNICFLSIFLWFCFIYVFSWLNRLGLVNNECSGRGPTVVQEEDDVILALGNLHQSFPFMAYYDTGKWPQFCNSSDGFDFSQISDLVGELNSHWGSLSCPSSDGHKFWGHEWEKHGTCSLNLDQHDYFHTALSLRSKIDLLTALKSAGIRPDGGEYRVSDIKEAIRNAIGKEVGVDCNVSEDGEYQLNDVYVCVAKSDASTVITCPVYPHSKCPFTVKFPLFGDEEDIATSSDQNAGSDEL